jgi:hypothetical protein
MLGIFLAAVFVPPDRWKNVSEAACTLIAPVSTLVGAVTGFYFAEKVDRARRAPAAGS